METDLASIRRQAGVSQNEAAVRAGVAIPTARIFEMAGPHAVLDEAKRAALIRVYDEFRRAATTR